MSVILISCSKCQSCLQHWQMKRAVQEDWIWTCDIFWHFSKSNWISEFPLHCSPWDCWHHCWLTKLQQGDTLGGNSLPYARGINPDTVTSIKDYRTTYNNHNIQRPPLQSVWPLFLATSAGVFWVLTLMSSHVGHKADFDRSLDLYLNGEYKLQTLSSFCGEHILHSNIHPFKFNPLVFLFGVMVSRLTIVY